MKKNGSQKSGVGVLAICVAAVIILLSLVKIFIL
jgi:hypothetical protein